MWARILTDMRDGVFFLKIDDLSENLCFCLNSGNYVRAQPMHVYACVHVYAYACVNAYVYVQVHVSNYTVLFTSIYKRTSRVDQKNQKHQI